MSHDEKTYEGQCYCGAVKITVTMTRHPSYTPHCHLARMDNGHLQRLDAVECMFEIDCKLKLNVRTVPIG